MNIGFIGLGIMGSRMAANLQKGRHSLAVYNRTRQKAELLLSKGGELADSPAALAAQAEVIFTMLAHPDAVEQAALGEEGFLSHLAPGRMWIDCSTVNPSFSRRMAAEARARGISRLIWKHSSPCWNAWETGLFIVADKAWALRLKW